MSRSRRFRLHTVLFALWALLFAQAVMAAYACPQLAKAVEVARMAEQGLPCAEAMAQELAAEDGSGLCSAHLQDQQRNVESPPTPSLAGAVQLGAVLQLAPPSVRPLPDGPQRPLLRPGASTPLAIRHCCFRT